jgi:hypothetical protein
MSIERTSSSHASTVDASQHAESADAQRVQQQTQIRHKARQYRHVKIRHSTASAETHGTAKANQLPGRTASTGVLHARVTARHGDSGHEGAHHGRQQHQQGGQHRQGGQHQQGGQQRQQQQRRQQQGQRREPPAVRAGSQQGAQPQPVRTAYPLELDERRSRVPGSPDRDNDSFPPLVLVKSAASETAPRTELQNLGAALREQPLLHGKSLRTAATEQCFAIGERLRRGEPVQLSRETLAVMLDLLRARSGGGNGAPLYDDVLQDVRQALIDTQTRLRRTPIGAPRSDAEATFNALLPLVELVNRRALTAPLAERAERHMQIALRGGGVDARNTHPLPGRSTSGLT